MSTTIQHVCNTCSITNMDLIKATTPQLMSEKNSTPRQGVPIVTNATLYTTYNKKIKKSTTFNTYPLTYVTTYARKDDVPNGDGTLFAVDHIYPRSFGAKLREKSSRFFRMNFIEFYQRLMVTPRNNRCYYECIEGDERKPYADIEYEYTEANKEKAFENFDQLIGYILLGIQYEMHDKDVPYDQEKDCILLSSHGPGKRSIHIIINNYYFDKCADVHNSNVKSFWLAVRNRVPQHLWHFAKIKHGSKVVEYKVDVNPNMPLILDAVRTSKKNDLSETIDTCVYSSFRQFRLIWNTKLGKDRFLDIDPSTSVQARFPKNPGDPDFLDDNLKRLRQFEGCLITMTSNCKKLPDWITPIVDTNKENVFKNLVDIDDKQRNSLIDAFNASRHSHIYRINYNQTTAKNSIYLDPITKPYDCLICGGNHSGNNAKLCYSAKGNIYVKCFASNKIEYIGKDFIKDNEEDDASDNDDQQLDFFGLDDNFIQYAQQNSIEIPDNVIKSIESNSINENRTYKLDGDLSQMEQKRVQATPIIRGIIQQHTVENTTITASPFGVCSNVINRPIINIETKNVDSIDVSPMKEGQIVLPSLSINIDSFLDGNTKFTGGNKYNVQDIYNSYERYRSGKGKKYNYEQGHFGRALTTLGHIITKEHVKGSKGSKTSFVTLKRFDPITNTNPVEELSKITGKTTAPALKPCDALDLLRQSSKSKSIPTPTTTTTDPIPEHTQPINKELRTMDQHNDIRNFWDIYMTEDPESKTDPDNLFLCFLEYCKTNNIISKGFGQTRLLNFIKKWLNVDTLTGWKCKTDMEEINNAKKEENIRRIWKYNNAPYQIGWHNGRLNERYSKLTTKQWKKIDVNYRNDKYCRPIPGLIELTNKFEKDLPDRVKEIQNRLLELQYLPIDNEEANNLKVVLSNALVDGIIVKDEMSNFVGNKYSSHGDSSDYVALKSHIEELEREAFVRNREEITRLQESIKDDKERLMQEISWCICVRSTFRTGKTFNLRPYIEAFPDMRILIVLPRTTLTDEYMMEYRKMGFAIYTEKPKGKISDPRVIVCYPSITRLDLSINYDLLVLDEYKAIKDLQHTLVKKMMSKKDRVTGVYKSKEVKCYKVLCELVANTKRVYVADALLTNAHVLEIAEMRQQSEEFDDRVTVYQNMYQKHRGNIVYTVDNQDLLTHQIIKFLREGKRVAVPTNIKGYGEFLHKKIMELDVNVTVSLSTGDNKPTKTLNELWQNVQCLIYSPTILAGNSYEEPIDAVCGYFEKISCDQADALQMLMRCREIISKSYYICFRNGPGKSPIPDNVYQSTKEVKNFFTKNKRSDLVGWSEEDILTFDVEYGQIQYHLMYLDSYVNFMKQGLVSDREYLFRMLLYMRDAGFVYGGNIYTKSDDKEEVAAIKVDKKQYSKERNENEMEENYTCADATTQEYVELTKKTNKTKDDLRRIRKYRIKRVYNVDNVPKWLFKIHKRNYRQYIRIKEYREINGVTDQDTFTRLITKIRNKRLDKKGVDNENTLTTELLTAKTINSDPGQDIDEFWTERDIKLCEYAIIILALTTGCVFIREYPRFETQHIGNRLKEYINQNEKDMRDLVNDFDISIDKLANKVTNKAFGIKVKNTPTGYLIENMWVLKGDNIWPYNKDINDREELRIMVPETTVSDKASSWKDKVISSINQGKYPTSKILTLAPKPLKSINNGGIITNVPDCVIPTDSQLIKPEFIRHGPYSFPKEYEYVNNNAVHTQVPIAPKIVTCNNVQKRIPAMPILNNNLRLASV